MTISVIDRSYSLLAWLLMLDAENDKTIGFSDKALMYTKVPDYVPGKMLLPIPDAGVLFSWLDIGFWAYILYLIGSVAYLADSIYSCLITDPGYADDFSNPVVYLNTIAAFIFVLNALFCFVDWYLQLHEVGAMNMYIDDQIPNKIFLAKIPRNLSAYYFYNNVFFMSAAVLYLVQAIWPTYTSLHM